ncbi:MAG: SusC/RagA family TonB-linked outer membrane protein [Gemmatimonadaceae bacterium]|jgi:TonB-linked SusC/RagA family outer membrane protein|nr:SusC/RagA family TonB-linked outer membrane protein [Gemmatimonadaceae bacterium]
MMQQRLLATMLSVALCASVLGAQPRTITGKVTRDPGVPLSGASVIVKGTGTGVQTNTAGDYSIRAEPGQVLQFRIIGYLPQERTVGTASVINVVLDRAAANLDAMVVTALGQTAVQRSLGAAQQSVQGEVLAQTGRDNFINALQGRVAGVEVTSTSGVPGASSSITIRGVSSISGSNQPLMVIDGLPMDNKTLNTSAFASDAPGSATSFSNRGVDFTNRAADINPEDIESVTVLKGPEAAALYGIDAANGAIVITTKRGQAGTGTFTYSNDFTIESVRAQPEVQRIYGPTGVAGDLLDQFQYFGAPYPAGTTFYDNVGGFFRQAVSQRHNLAFSGATQDSRLGYRVSVSGVRRQGVIPNAENNTINVTGASNAQVTKWLKADLSMQYSTQDNTQVFTGANGPLMGLLLWPQTDRASDFLTPAGTRRRITRLAGNTETDNPYFSVSRNQNTAQNNRLITSLSLIVTPFSWGNIKTSANVDNYTNQVQIVRNPETAPGVNVNGILDQLTDVTRNINSITLLNINKRKLIGGWSISGFAGNQITVNKSLSNGLGGQNFLDPNFVSMNNTQLRLNRTILTQRRLMSAFGQATLNFRDYFYVNVSGRNDWTSTIPRERNSFFYPSYSASFVVSDAFKSVGKVMTAKLRSSYAAVGFDARPYAFRPALEFKTTTGGGYGYGFTGPNLNLAPEFRISREYGGEFGFFDNRLGVDVAVYRASRFDQIVNDIRGSYGTGFILFNLNGTSTFNYGTEVSVKATPWQKGTFSWDVLANYDRARGRVTKLPNDLPESYVSDTWLYGNVRNGTGKGLSTRALTGTFYLRNNQGKLLIDPTNGLPLRSLGFVDAGYDRQPDFQVGLTNTFRWRRASLSFLVDFRRGGDVFNATEHLLTTRGLSNRTLDRERPRVIDGVLRDGRENSATPTPNTIVVLPAAQPLFYTGISEELFIEKDINWIRLRDVTLRYALPGRYFAARDASFFIRGTDLWLTTNYSGLDPIVNGNSAAVGGSGGQGIDLGNFPMPRGFAFGIKMGY